MRLITALFLALAIGLNAQVLATVNKEDITKDEVNSFLKTTNQEKTYDALDQKAKNLALHQTIEKTLLVQTAKKEKMDNTKEFKKAVEDFKNSLLVESFMKNEFAKIKVSKEQVENYYNAHIYEFEQGKKLKARHILVEDLKIALDIINKLEGSKNKEVTFVELASENSIDGSRDKGGDIGWFKEGDMIDEFWSASVKLKPQEFTKEPVKSVFGYHIIFLDEIQEPLTIKLDQVYSNIENQIKMETFQGLIDEKIKSIKQAAQINIK